MMTLCILYLVQVTYHFTRHSQLMCFADSDTFVINDTTGNITLARTLDREVTVDYQLTVEVSYHFLCTNTA